jgi:hypothetical protein
VQDLAGLSRQHGDDADTEEGKRQEHAEQDERGRTSPAPAVLLVQPEHRRLEGEGEQLGDDQVADEVPLPPQEPQRRQREQDGGDRVADALADDLGRRRRSCVLFDCLVRRVDQAPPNLGAVGRRDPAGGDRLHQARVVALGLVGVRLRERGDGVSERVAPAEVARDHRRVAGSRVRAG